MAEERVFTDKTGQRWRVSYAEGGARGMLTMKNIVFEALNGDEASDERYLTVHQGYLESVDDHQLEVALSQAQRVDSPW